MTNKKHINWKKRAIVIAGFVVGTLSFYVIKESINEFNRVVDENDKLREYIAKHCISKNKIVDVTLSNGKRYVNYPKTKLNRLESYETDNIKVTKYNNGFELCEKVSGE